MIEPTISDRAVQPKKHTETVPAIYARLCLDCDKPGTVYDSRFGACPNCGSRAGMAIRHMAERRSA